MSLGPMVLGGNASEARAQFWMRVLEGVRSLPCVGAASLSVLTPSSGRDTAAVITVSGYTAQRQSDRQVHLNHVSEDDFATFGVAVRAGRVFTANHRGSIPNRRLTNTGKATALLQDLNRPGLGQICQGGRKLQA